MAKLPFMNDLFFKHAFNLCMAQGVCSVLLKDAVAKISPICSSSWEEFIPTFSPVNRGEIEGA